MMRLAVWGSVLLATVATESTTADIPGVRAAAFSKDGSLFAACAAVGTDDGELAIWRILVD